MGVVGFDLGGAVALVVAATRTLGAAVTVGSEVPSANLVAMISAEQGLTCPWLGIYGTDDPEIDRLRQAASSSEVATDVVVFPGEGGHRFDDDPDAAAEAWQRTLNWFDADGGSETDFGGSILGGITLSEKLYFETKFGLGDVPDWKLYVGFNK